jgi:hypothetical protein
LSANFSGATAARQAAVGLRRQMNRGRPVASAEEKRRMPKTSLSRNAEYTMLSGPKMETCYALAGSDPDPTDDEFVVRCDQG